MQKFLFRQITNLSQANEPKLNILMYHRVMPESDPLRPWEVNSKQFRKHMEWISNVYNVIPLPKAIEQLKSGKLKRRSLAITFDDGYLDNATEALPILQEFGFHATFFCTSAWLEGGIMWNDKIIESIRVWPEKVITVAPLDLPPLPINTNEEKNKAIETILPCLKYIEHNKRQEIADQIASQVCELPELMMKPRHIKQLNEQGMEIGGHTHSHPIMANLNSDSAIRQLQQNKSVLESIIEKEISLFAYPNGKPNIDFQDNQIPLVEQAGYIGAVTTQPGTSKLNTNTYQLNRFTPWDISQFKYLCRLALN